MLVGIRTSPYLCTRRKPLGGTSCGSSSVGRASASQAEGHEFEPRLPLSIVKGVSFSINESDTPSFIIQDIHSLNDCTSMQVPFLSIDFGQLVSDLGHEFTLFSLEQIYKSFFTLFVTIDIIGAIPIILSLKSKGKVYHATQVGVYSGIILLTFLLVGEPLLGSFGADISTFGVAGGIVLFVMAVEMIFGLEIFKSEDDSDGNSTFVPLVFPLFAGAASFTTMLTLRADGVAIINLAVSIVLNMVIVYLVLRYVSILDRLLGKNGVYILRKFFGVVLLAISVKFITKNLIDVIAMVQHGVEELSK